MSEVTTHQVVGFCDGIMLKGDWQEFHINIGRQYPVKLASKQEDIKAAAMAAGKNQAVWTYSERDGNPNPHKPGEFFKNRYLEKVEVGGTPDPALVGQQAQSNAPQGGGVSGGQMPSDGREVSIERQSLIKAALPLLALEQWDEDTFFGFISRLDDWMGRKRTPVEGETPEAVEEQQQDDPDEIPF